MEWGVILKGYWFNKGDNTGGGGENPFPDPVVGGSVGYPSQWYEGYITNALIQPEWDTGFVNVPVFVSTTRWWDGEEVKTSETEQINIGVMIRTYIRTGSSLIEDNYNLYLEEAQQYFNDNVIIDGGSSNCNKFNKHYQSSGGGGVATGVKGIVNPLQLHEDGFLSATTIVSVNSSIGTTLSPSISLELVYGDGVTDVDGQACINTWDVTTGSFVESVSSLFSSSIWVISYFAYTRYYFYIQ